MSFINQAFVHCLVCRIQCHPLHTIGDIHGGHPGKTILRVALVQAFNTVRNGHIRLELHHCLNNRPHFAM